MSSSIFPPSISESDLARRLGVARYVLRELRTQLDPDHWQGGNGRPVLYSSEGESALAELLKKNAALDGPPAADRYVTLQVVRVANPRALLAKKIGAHAGDEPLRIIVRASANFLPGMLLEQCEPSTEAPGVFYYHGRLPRRRGRM